MCPNGTIPYETECLDKKKVVEVLDAWIGDAFSDLQRGAKFQRYESDTGYGGGWYLANLDKVQNEFAKDVMKKFHFNDDALDDVKSIVSSAFDDIESKYESDDECPGLSNTNRKAIAKKLGGTMFTYRLQKVESPIWKWDDGV